MGFLRRWISSNTNAARESEVVDSIDSSLPDGEWLARSEERYRQMVEQRWGSPETVAQGGADRYGHGDFGVALFFFQKSIDMLHTQYLFAQMRNRQPSPADAWIVDGYPSALGASLQLHPAAPVDTSVREVTHRLRTIAAACERAGVPSQLYRDGLDLMAVYAPHVKLDDVLGVGDRSHGVRREVRTDAKRHALPHMRQVYASEGLEGVSEGLGRCVYLHEFRVPDVQEERGPQPRNDQGVRGQVGQVFRFRCPNHCMRWEVYRAHNIATVRGENDNYEAEQTA